MVRVLGKRMLLTSSGHVLLVIVLLLAQPTTAIFVLEGSPTSYAQFRKWHAGLNGSLEFEFKTEDANGLLMYTDDGGTFDFFEVKLVEGALRLRFNLGGGASILTVGHNLHDNAWHKVSIVREFEETRLVVDKELQSRVSRGNEFYFGNFTTNSYVYMGGMPGWYSSKLTQLALPSVIFEPRFRGAIRNVVYANDEGPAKRQEMIEYKGVRFQKLDVCEHQDPCQHGGICISTDNGAICNCRAIDFEGTFCEKDSYLISLKE
uniref:Laminin G domain-containing protein n=1 Tax=Strigamia maritima TaxID=126957 RepID=T1IME3_STRMM